MATVGPAGPTNLAAVPDEGVTEGSSRSPVSCSYWIFQSFRRADSFVGGLKRPPEPVPTENFHERIRVKGEMSDGRCPNSHSYSPGVETSRTAAGCASTDAGAHEVLAKLAHSPFAVLRARFSWPGFLGEWEEGRA